MTTIFPWKDAWRDPAFWISTWFGSGLVPFAPGTWGTLAALPFGWGLYCVGGPPTLLLGAFVALLIGVWASNRYMAQTGRHDPGSIVIDEVAGVWITLAALPTGAAWYFWLVAFALFRFFDIVKPWPIRVLDRNVGGGWGVMLDDIVAGLLVRLSYGELFMFSEAVIALATTVITRAQQADMMIATAESCTGGLLSACLTSIPGASSVLDRGFVTYSNEAKMEMLGVPSALIEQHGAVSEQVALAMANGALAQSRAQLTVSVTGVAGPGGGTAEKPVGLVWFGAARSGFKTVGEDRRFGDIGRDNIREKSVEVGLLLLNQLIPEGR